MVLTVSDRFVVDSFTPAYLDPGVRVTMAQRLQAALAELQALGLTAKEKEALVAFLRNLSGEIREGW